MNVQIKNKPFTWSPSSIKAYQTCPLKAWGTYWNPNAPPYKSTPATEYGEKVHKALELAIGSSMPLPGELTYLQKWVNSVNNLPGVKSCEGKFAFNRNWERVDYFAPDVYGRTVVDLLVYTSPESVCAFDWKTGKSRYDTNEQLVIELIAAETVNPNITNFQAAYIYTEEDKLGEKLTFDKATLQREKNLIQNQINLMEESYNAKYFEPTKNGLCKNYCDVLTCPYNGKR